MEKQESISAFINKNETYRNILSRTTVTLKAAR